MSRLMGGEHDRWTLTRAIDALGDAARQAGPPGLIWVAGIFYPAISLSLGNSGEFALIQGRDSDVKQLSINILNLQDPWMKMPIILVPFFLPFVMRLNVGLARISSPQRWRELTVARRAPRLRDAWRAGNGLALSSFGLWLQLIVMVAGAALLLLAPPFFFMRGVGLRIEDSNWQLGTMAALMGPFIAVFLMYGLLVSVLYQLALQSLAQNRRGVASAIHHAWRIARNDPWATARAVLVDFLLYVTTVTLIGLLSLLLLVTIVGIPLIPLTVILLGFAGTTRACYWARTYRVLGGLSAEDGVPGL